MGDIKNLVSAEAVAKIKELALGADIALFSTNLLTLPLTTRPMSTQGVDEEGNLWFLSKKNSNKNQDIAKDSRVQLFYSNKGSSEYLSVFGHAEIIFDKEKIDQYWTPIAKAWFTEGKDDASISVIKVVPADVYYWDTKEGKILSLIKIAYGAITGSKIDGGVEGKIKI